MAKSTSSNYKTKKEAQNALDRFKMEVASEIDLRHNPFSSIVLIISAALSAGSIRIAFFLFEETIYTFVLHAPNTSFVIFIILYTPHFYENIFMLIISILCIYKY